MARIVYLVSLVCLLAGAAWAASSSVTLNFQRVNGFDVKFVAVNMRDPEVTVTTAVAAGFPRGGESWSSFLTRLQPDAAINGTYFSTSTMEPVGDVAVDGNLLFTGVAGTALCITSDNHVAVCPGPSRGRTDWTGYRTVLCAGPRLLANGEVALNPRAEGFRDPRVLGSAPRSAVVWRRDGLLLLLTIEQSISLGNLAAVCRQLGGLDALALDGGDSSGLYANGRTVTQPERRLSNILAVYTSRERFREMQAHLMPGGPAVLASLLSKSPALPWNTTVKSVFEAPIAPPITAALPPVGAPAAKPAVPVVRITRPAPAQPVRGRVQVAVEVANGEDVGWTTLRINDAVCFISNIWPLTYEWDSTQEADGVSIIEVTAWAADQRLLVRELREVSVCNSP